MHDDNRRSWADAYAVFAFLQRFQWLVQILVFAVGIGMIIWGVFANRKKALEAPDPVEATFWYLRYLSCCIGTYGLAYFVMLLIDAHVQHLPFLQYWPLIDMLWIDHSWYGDYDHTNAIYGEPLFIAGLAFLVRAASRVYGSYDELCESFTPTDFAMRQWLAQQIEPLQRLHPEYDGRFSLLSDAERARLRQEWKNKYRWKYDQLVAKRSAYTRSNDPA
ncbi:MAG TPA: hypothetical protein VJ654_17940 [Noviherbaspirillum sp.]|nr:hypothetical protein [Noviherbaspirillum sp.]